MESEDKKPPECSNGLVKDIKLQWPENLTVLDLSNKQISVFEENIIFPPSLTNLNLSHNSLCSVPDEVLKLTNIKCLDIAHNSIKYFDDIPSFCQSIEELDVSHNRLVGPPYWIWTESPANLVKLNLSCNMNLTFSLTDEYLDELMQYKTLVKEVIIFNCGIKKHSELLGTFPAAKSMEIGAGEITTYQTNHLPTLPCKGIDECLEIERLNLSNTEIYSLEKNIDIYNNLVEIDLSYNCIGSVPTSFCNLEKLEICILSHNNIMYLPDDIVKLKKLTCLRLDSNDLCMLPENLGSLPNLKILDLYNNCLYEVADEVMKIEEIDVAQNYFDEPENEEYLKRKEKLRLNMPHRDNGRKYQLSPPESDDKYSPDTSEDEDFINYINNCEIPEPLNTNAEPERTSSPEDWDSDEYWVPRYYQSGKYTESPWLHFVKRKMNDGNFCPMDIHTVPIIEKVQYEKMCNPQVFTVAEGQFDDLSSDES
ncbi:leucine rich repeat domain-containing protein [Phthorimaea operculella]|nr:leucine rich repeat domain-containing protein [Phthorimaea operculella]